MKGNPIPIPSGHQLYNWAQKMVEWMRVVEAELENKSPKSYQLEHAKNTAKATTDGLLMWDSVDGCVIVSKGGAWYKLDMTPMILLGKKDKAKL